MPNKLTILLLARIILVHTFDFTSDVSSDAFVLVKLELIGNRCIVTLYLLTRAELARLAYFLSRFLLLRSKSRVVATTVAALERCDFASTCGVFKAATFAGLVTENIATGVFWRWHLLGNDIQVGGGLQLCFLAQKIFATRRFSLIV